MNRDIQSFIRCNIEHAREHWLRLGGVESFYRFGAIRICVRHIGETLVDTVMPAVRHALDNDDNEASSGVIYTLDAAALGLEKPPVAWPFETESHQGHQRIHWDAGNGLALNSDETHGIWQLFDLSAGAGLYWVADEKNLPAWEAGSPLRIFLHWLAWQSGDQLIHAAGLAWENNGILLTGPGGSGKSTTTAAAVNAGWKTVGDDFVLSVNGSVPKVCCIYDTIKLTSQSLDRLTGFSRKVVRLPRVPDDKARLHLGENFGQQLVSEISVNAVFSLRITNSIETSIIPASRACIMTALAPTTMFMLKTGMQESFRKMTALVNQLAAYTINLGTDPQEAVEKLTRHMEKRET